MPDYQPIALREFVLANMIAHVSVWDSNDKKVGFILSILIERPMNSIRNFFFVVFEVHNKVVAKRECSK